MKKLFFILVIFLFTVNSCIKVERDDPCESGCVTFKGKIETPDHTGIQGVNLILNYTSNNLFFGVNQDLGQTTTDENGNYLLKINIPDNLIHSRNFSLRFNPSTIQGNDDCYKPDVKVVYKIDEILTEYDVFESNFTIPKKSHLSVRLKDFFPVISDDYFKFIFLYNYANDNQGWYADIQKDLYAKQNQNPTVYEIDVPLNKDFDYILRKTKNGQGDSQYLTGHHSSPTTQILEFEY